VLSYQKCLLGPNTLAYYDGASMKVKSSMALTPYAVRSMFQDCVEGTLARTVGQAKVSSILDLKGKVNFILQIKLWLFYI
jgi:hypothetical protein